MPGSNLATLEGHGDMTTHLRTHDDILTSSDTDGSVRLWNLDSYKQTQMVVAHPMSSLNALVVLNDYKVVTAGSDGRILLWGSKPRQSSDCAKGEFMSILECGERGEWGWNGGDAAGSINSY